MSRARVLASQGRSHTATLPVLLFVEGFQLPLCSSDARRLRGLRAFDRRPALALCRSDSCPACDGNRPPLGATIRQTTRLAVPLARCSDKCLDGCHLGTEILETGFGAQPCEVVKLLFR
jgi:hypothetical protein